MIWSDTPPADPADHAEDFSRRYAEDLEIATGQVMIDLGLSKDEMGMRDIRRGSEHFTFYPDETDGGGISPTGQVTIDSGVMNPDALDGLYGKGCGNLWRKTRLRDRMQAIISHEKAEHDNHGNHELALIAAPETGLAISRPARELLRAMELGWKGYPR